MPKIENKTGRNFARNSNVDYKKVRRDVFELVEQLICSNTILTASLQHNEVLQRKCLATIQDMKAKINNLEIENKSLDSVIKTQDDQISVLDHKIDQQNDLIENMSADVIKEAGDKAFGKKEAN